MEKQVGRRGERINRGQGLSDEYAFFIFFPIISFESLQ